jgi:hypothetical protein
LRFPPRNDQPIPATYAKQGFVREELTSAADVRKFEKTSGRIHERTHYNPGSGAAERDLAIPDEGFKRDHKDEALTKRLVEALR